MAPPGPPHRPTALSSTGSRALIVGSGRHIPGSLLPDVPAAGETVRELGRTLVERCGLRAEHLRTLTDPEDPRALGTALTEVAAEATDVLLLYYVGHGLVSPGNELYLATRATSDPVTGLTYNALSYQAVRDTLSECRARSVVVVLDCCFAGRARGAFGTAATHAFELASFGGTYVLTSASADEQALAPAGARYTAFTGELLALLHDGDRTGLPDLTVEDAYRHLRRVLPARGLPEPHRHLSDRAGELVLAGNPAAGPARVPDRPPGTDHEGPEPPCPYRGLRSFTADDAAYFFGREQLVGEVLRKMSEWSDNGGPVAVVGPSGAGKSSLLHAGLLPAIRRGELRVTGSETWPHLSLVPGEHPWPHWPGGSPRTPGCPRRCSPHGCARTRDTSPRWSGRHSPGRTRGRTPGKTGPTPGKTGPTPEPAQRTADSWSWWTSSRSCSPSAPTRPSAAPSSRRCARSADRTDPGPRRRWS